MCILNNFSDDWEFLISLSREQSASYIESFEKKPKKTIYTHQKVVCTCIFQAPFLVLNQYRGEKQSL